MPPLDIAMTERMSALAMLYADPQEWVEANGQAPNMRVQSLQPPP